MRQRFLAFVLVMVMVVCMMPTFAVSAETVADVPQATSASDKTTADEATWDEATTDEKGIEYKICDGEATVVGYKGTDTEVIIPSIIDEYPVTVIGTSAFFGCDTLWKIDISDGVRIIEYSAFMSCEKLMEVTLPKSLTHIGEYAFANCRSLAIVNIPESLERLHIYQSAFEECYSLMEFVIPEGTAFIGEDAFASCESLVSIRIPAGVNMIGRNPFTRCINLEEIIVDENNPVYDSKGNCNAIIENGNNLITGCKNTVIPDRVTNIDSFAFLGLSIKNVVIPEGVTNIGRYVFEGCYELEEIVLPSTLESVEQGAFNINVADDCLDRVYYAGTQEQWNKIVFEKLNECLLNANVRFNAAVATVAGYSITLSGNIGVNAFVDMPVNVYEDKIAKVVFTYGNVTEEVPVSEGVQTENGYKFTCEISAKDMTSEVTCEVVSSVGNSDSFTYSVKDYAEIILANPNVYGENAVNIVKSMLNYGANAQLYFGYNTDVLANDTKYMSDSDKSVEEKDFSGYKFTVSEGEGEIEYYGTALSLESETSMLHYFIVGKDVNINNINVTVNGETAMFKRSGNLYVLKIADIPAHKLYDSYDIAVGDISFSYGVFNYAAVAQSAGKATLVRLMSALEIYAQNAAVYKN